MKNLKTNNFATSITMFLLLLLSYKCATKTNNRNITTKNMMTSTKADTKKALQKTWMLTKFENFSKQVLMDKKASIDLTSDSIAFCQMGCNKINFKYIVKNNKTIIFSNGVSTEMYCNDMTLEDAFTKNMPNITNYSIQGHELILTSPQGKTMVFIAQDWD